MKHKVAELEGTLLDAAVAKADGRLVEADEPGWRKGDYERLRAEYGGRHVVRWYAESDPSDLGGWEPLDNQGSPSTDWDDAGPIIERERIAITPCPGGGWDASPDRYLAATIGRGPTPLIAAMRAYVASKFGEEVELP